MRKTASTGGRGGVGRDRFGAGAAIAVERLPGSRIAYKHAVALQTRHTVDCRTAGERVRSRVGVMTIQEIDDHVRPVFKRMPNRLRGAHRGELQARSGDCDDGGVERHGRS